MVLDEASPTADSFSSDDSAFGANTAPRNGSTLTLPRSIELSTFARPVPIFGAALGYNDDLLKAIVEQDGNHMSRILRRPLTVPEWEAATFHMAKMHSYASYGWPLGTALGGWQAYRTRESWRFPFYKPNLEEVGHKFNSFGPLKDQAARAAWQSLRFACYQSLIGGAVKVVTTAYAINVAWAGQRMDPRLQDFWSTLRDLKPEEIRERGNTSLSASSEDTADPIDQQDIAREYPQEPAPTEQMRRQEPPGSRRRVDQSNIWEQRRQAAAKGGTMPQAGPTPPAPRDQSLTDYDFDDASPMARDVAPAKDASSQSGSAWDRVRQGNTPRSLPNQQFNPNQSAQSNAWSRARSSAVGANGQGTQSSQDTFSFSSADSDRQLARDEAQRNFDERVERERHGENFGEPPSGRKR